VAIAWILAQRPWIVPIPGTTKQHRVDENIAATAIALEAADLGAIADAVSAVEIQGARYTEQLDQLVDR
jgi:aryl-alcohol dehydrogenase-like predicted oxidoreductase